MCIGFVRACLLNEVYTVKHVFPATASTTIMCKEIRPSQLVHP